MAEPVDRRRVQTSEPGVPPIELLDRELQRLRRRAGRQWRAYQGADDGGDRRVASEAHAAWSHSVDEALAIVEIISRRPAHDIVELAIKFEAIVWWVMEDDSLIDAAARRWLVRFRRSLRHVAR